MFRKFWKTWMRKKEKKKIFRTCNRTRLQICLFNEKKKKKKKKGKLFDLENQTISFLCIIGYYIHWTSHQSVLYTSVFILAVLTFCLQKKKEGGEKTGHHRSFSIFTFQYVLKIFLARGIVRRQVLFFFLRIPWPGF